GQGENGRGPDQSRPGNNSPADAIPKRYGHGQGPEPELGLGSRGRPEHDPSQQLKQSGGQRQGCQQRHGQAQGNGGTGAPYFGEFGAAHQPPTADPPAAPRPPGAPPP